jgi:hypothetical protein
MFSGKAWSVMGTDHLPTLPSAALGGPPNRVGSGWHAKASIFPAPRLTSVPRPRRTPAYVHDDHRPPAHCLAATKAIIAGNCRCADGADILISISSGGWRFVAVGARGHPWPDLV